MTDSQKKTRSWSCDDSFYKEVEKAAKKMDLSVSQYLRMCVRKADELMKKIQEG